jgi:hypothetical protein
MTTQWHIVFLLAALAVAAAPCAAQSKLNQAGEIRALVPTGHVLRGTAPAIAAQRSDPLYWLDTVRTDRGGRIRIGLLDGSILNVGSESSLSITQHDPSAQQTQLELTYGRMRANAVRITQPRGNFEVRTPVAVTGVVGTGFDIEATDDLTVVLCRENSVRVRNVDDRVAGEVILHAGEITQVRRGMPPTPPMPASPEQLRESQEATSIPVPPLDWSRVEVSWPPPDCGAEFTLLLRAWSKQTQDGKAVETPLDPELIAGTLLLGNTSLAVEGGRASFASAPGGSAPEGTFIPQGKQTPIAVKIWPPIKVTEGQSWRAPRAEFVGSAFYVLGPVGLARQLAFTFADQPATVLWVGPCGAGFLAPTLPGGTYGVTLSVSGRPVARGQMNLVQVLYDQPRPPVLLRGQPTRFGIEFRGLGSLDQFVQGRPIEVTVVTNQTPAILGDVRSQTRGARVAGETITYRVSASNMDASGTARLEATGKGRQRGGFNLGVENKLDEALELPNTPLTLVQQPGP